MHVLERLRRCRHCRRDMMNVTEETFAENPYCEKCLGERLQRAGGEQQVEWRLVGDYLVRVTKAV